MGWVVSAMPQPLYSQEGDPLHMVQASLDRYVKFCLHRDLIPRLSSLYKGFSNVAELWDESVTLLHTDGSI